MKRFALLALAGAALLIIGSTTVLAAGRLAAPTAAAQDATAAVTPAWSSLQVNATVDGPRGKGRDGGACSSGEECQSGTCEGGSCCTDHGDTCDSSSHCCGHQSCGADAKCP